MHDKTEADATRYELKRWVTIGCMKGFTPCAAPAERAQMVSMACSTQERVLVKINTPHIYSTTATALYTGN